MPDINTANHPSFGEPSIRQTVEPSWLRALDRLAAQLELGSRSAESPRAPMSQVLHYFLVPLFLLGSAQCVRAQDFVDLPRDLEVALALSALPEALQDDASIYVRDSERGYVVHRDGTNGWMTFVARTSVRFYAADWEYNYPTDMLIPQAHTDLGLQNHVQPYFYIERLRIAGTPAAEAKRLLRERFSDGTYTAPERGGLSYMLAPMHRAYMAPAQSGEIMTVSFPHHMPYAPHVSPMEFGAMDPYGRSGVLDHGGTDAGPHGYFYLLIQPDQVAEIQVKYADLLDRLCDQHAGWCLPEGSGDE